MIDFFKRLFDTSDFPPRWYCGQWSAAHGWLHILSDLAIAGAYLAIPCILTYFVLRRKDLPFLPIYYLFAMFILACGIGHGIEATLFWQPWYRFAGLSKLVTAVVSWVTVIAMIPFVPRALALPGLAAVNEQLRQEIFRREKAEEQRRQLEAHMQQTQKLESLGVLAGGIAHDFNNLLTSIHGYAELAKLEIPTNSSAQTYLDEVINGAQKAAELTNQMLAFSGRSHFVLQSINLNDLIASMDRFLQVSIHNRCELIRSLMPELPNIDGDASQIRQIITNLLINASESFEEKEGEIFLRTGVIYCNRNYLSQMYLDDNLPEGRYVFLEVADTGCGMSEQTKEKIFDPFFSTKFAGRGMGLPAVLGIVRGLHGAIKVDSDPGKGSIFRVLFPVGKSTPEPIKPSTKPAPSRQMGTILIIDDEEMVRSVAGVMLEEAGYTIVTAAGGEEGLAIFKENPDRFSLVLLDLTMPHMDGEETLTALRTIRTDLPAVLMSGYTEESIKQRFGNKRLGGFLKKPFRINELYTVVQHALEDAQREK